MEQDSALSPILSVLYIASLIHIFEHRAQALNLNTSILSFVNNVLLISQGKTYNKILPELYSSYRVVTDLIVMFGLVIKHNKSEIFHFSKMHNDLNPELNFSAIVPLFSNPRHTGDTWAFTSIDACFSRNTFGTTLPRHCPQSKQ